MQIKKAYTTFEMLLLLAMILVMTLFSVPAIKITPMTNQQILNKITSLINETRLNALKNKETSTITFTKNTISTPNHFYRLEKGNFTEKKAFTYLKNGHIQKGGHVTFCNGKCYDIIFNVGNGAVRIE